MKYGEAYGGSKFLKAEHLMVPNKPNTFYRPELTISEWEIATFQNEGEADRSQLVIHFAGKDKGFGLNKTNMERLVEICGIAITEDTELEDIGRALVGWKIKLYVENVKMKDGSKRPAIRVSTEYEAVPPEKNPDAAGLKVVSAAAGTNGGGVEDKSDIPF
jgi:hypothetical protein